MSRGDIIIFNRGFISSKVLRGRIGGRRLGILSPEVSPFKGNFPTVIIRGQVYTVVLQSEAKCNSKGREAVDQQKEGVA